MKKKLRFAFSISLILNLAAIFIILVCLLDLRLFIYNHVFTPSGSSHSVKRHVDWVVEEEWEATSLNVEFVHKQFNLFNTYTALRIDGALKIKNDKKWSKSIKHFFVSHSYELIDNKYVAVIEINPRFRSKESEEHPEFNLEEFTLVEKVQNRNWGSNHYRVVFDDKSIELETIQKK